MRNVSCPGRGENASPACEFGSPSRGHGNSGEILYTALKRGVPWSMRGRGNDIVPIISKTTLLIQLHPLSCRPRLVSFPEAALSQCACMQCIHNTCKQQESHVNFSLPCHAMPCPELRAGLYPRQQSAGSITDGYRVRTRLPS